MIHLQAEVDESIANIIARIREFDMDFPLSRLFPTAAQAAKLAAYSIQEQWKAYAGGEPLPSGDRVKHPTGGYAASIQTKKESMWEYTISSKAAVASWMENGTPEIDMKQTHPFGERGRVANKGTKKNPRWVPYVIVPFRWATPGSGAHMGIKNVIPEQIYKQIQAGVRKGSFSRSVVLDGKTASDNFWGQSQTRNTYQWGSRLQAEGNIGGLVAMAGKPKSNGTRESSYFTFRIISADSPAGSWIKPATKPLRVAEQTAEVMADKVSKAVEDGFMADLEGMQA